MQRRGGPHGGPPRMLPPLAFFFSLRTGRSTLHMGLKLGTATIQDHPATRRVRAGVCARPI